MAKRLVVLLLALSLYSCVKGPSPDQSAEPSKDGKTGAQPATTTTDPRSSASGSAQPGGIEFVDATSRSGIRFKHNSGAYGKKYLPETMGSGCAFLDYDNDGWQDILLINGMNWPERKGPKSFSALYHNNRDGTFTDVTREAGLMVEMYGMGCAVADYDNDGLVDLYITCLGPNRLFRNLGGGKFSDVTVRAGVGDPGFSTSAAFFDYDKDGKLDLFICNYVEWTAETDIYCTLDGKNKTYCDPKSYKGQSPTLYRNKGGGTFENVTQRAGLLDASCKSLGVALTDFDNDGWTDLFVANDTQPNRLYKNNGDGTFTDVAMAAGVAFSEAGVARAGMGVDTADYDSCGRESVVIGNFSNEMMALYHNEGNGLFIDEAPTSTIGKASLLTLTFGCFFFDYDLDGLLDIFAVNGHVQDDINTVQQRVKYAEPPHLFRNLGKKRFEEVTSRLGEAIEQPIVGRGAAYGDFDNDGDLDLLVTANNGPARLLRNDGANQNNFLRVRVAGVTSSRDGIGARITLKLEGGSTIWGVVKTGSSYCSQSELPVTFGLGKSATVPRVEVAWPSGKLDTAMNVPANQLILIKEGQGLVTTAPAP